MTRPGTDARSVVAAGPSTDVDTVRTVVFDVGLTLMRAQPSFWDVFRRGCARAGVDLGGDVDAFSDEFSTTWREHSEAWEATGRPSPHVGDPDAEEEFWTLYYRRFLDALGVAGDHAAVAASIYATFLASDSFAPFPDVAPTLDALAERGVRLGILSNWGRWLRRLLGDHGLADRFEVIVVSGEEGTAKPNPVIFRRTLERLGERPGPHVAYVGDDPHNDINPARALGLTAVLVDRGDRHTEHDGHRVRDLRELPDLLPLIGRRDLPPSLGRPPRNAGGDGRERR